MRRAASLDSVYRWAAAGASLFRLPQLPCPSMSGRLDCHGWAMRTMAS